MILRGEWLGFKLKEHIRGENVNIINFLKSWYGYSNSQLKSNEVCVVWIHGANQTGLSFQYLRSLTNFPNEIILEYDSSNKFYDNLEILAKDLKNKSQVYFIVGHSLGGLYAIHLTKHIVLVGAVTISTPFAGSWTADWAKFFVPSYQLFRDVGRRSSPINDAKSIHLNVPWTQIVSTSGGVPYHGGPNDGVCTIKSMKSRMDMELVEVPHTHFEVMCSDVVAQIILNSYYSVSEKT